MIVGTRARVLDSNDRYASKIIEGGLNRLVFDDGFLEYGGGGLRWIMVWRPQLILSTHLQVEEMRFGRFRMLLSKRISVFLFLMAAISGKASQRGAELAIVEINAAGGRAGAAP